MTNTELKVQLRRLRDSVDRLESWTQHKHPADHGMIVAELEHVQRVTGALQNFYVGKLN